jgi:hypothetical protein
MSAFIEAVEKASEWTMIQPGQNGGTLIERKVIGWKLVEGGFLPVDRWGASRRHCVLRFRDGSLYRVPTMKPIASLAGIADELRAAIDDEFRASGAMK